MSSKRKAEDGQSPQLRILHACCLPHYNALCRESQQHPAAFAGVLAVNPDMNSRLRSFQSPQPYDGPATPSDTPSPFSGNVNDCLAGASSNTAPLVAGERGVRKYKKILPYPSPAGSSPTPLVACADQPNPNRTPESNQGESPTTPDETNEEPMTERRKRANSKANSEINNIGVESWMFELRKELAGARKDALEKLKALEAGPSPEQSSQADVVNGINELHRRLGGKKTVQRLTVFRKRYDRWHTAETLQGCYDAQSSPNTGQTLQAVEVAKAVLGDRISHMSDKQAQTKWKEESRKNKFWHRLVEEFGFAILQVLSPRLTDENARNLSNRDADAFILSLKEKWPSLREDTKGLSGMLSHFAKTGSLPEERLCLERARDGQIFINSRAQLLSYSNKCSCWNEAGGASPVVAQLVDPSSGAPASAPAPGGQTTSDADASATANVEENSMMPVISEDFGATNASAEADWAATFEGLSPLEIGSLADDDYNAWGFTGQEMPSMFDFSPTSEHRDEA